MRETVSVLSNSTLIATLMMLKAAAISLLATAVTASIDADKIEKLPGWEKALPSPQCKLLTFSSRSNAHSASLRVPAAHAPFGPPLPHVG